MMKRSPKLFLEDIRESIDRIEQYTEGKTKEKFLDNYEIQDAIIRRFEIIGEATKNISDKIKEKYPEIPWKEMAGIRDVFVHEYFGVVMERVWDTAKNDVPKLKKQIKELLKSL